MNESRYVIPCLCGRIVESHQRASRCPACHRMLYVCTVQEAEAAQARERAGQDAQEHVCPS